MNRANPALPSQLQALIEGGPAALEAVQRAIDARGSAPDGAVVPLADARLYAPRSQGNRIACAGANYVMHVVGFARRRPHGHAGGTVPPVARGWPGGFRKLPDTVRGPEDDVTYPARATRFDYEGEAVVLVGKLKDVPLREAKACFWGNSA